MIESISINNYALIDKTDITLEKGFSVITGETGAGKSILLGAIGLTLGQRADASAIMDKLKKCVVEIEYSIVGYHLNEWFLENDLDYSENVVVRREFTVEGKSRCFINDTPVSNKLLKDFGSFMVDVHSQHQSLLLGQPEYQIEILDSFCDNGELLKKYQAQYQIRKKLLAELKEMNTMAENAEKEIDYLKFQFSKLENANLQKGEKETLEEELDLLTNAENIKSVLSSIPWNLRDMEHSVIEVLKDSRNAMMALDHKLREAGEYAQRLDSVIIELNDIADETERKTENIEYNAGRIEKINSRLNVIYDLLYKYKVESVAELMNLRDELQGKLKKVEESSEEIEKLEKRLKEAETNLRILAGEIHQIRTVAAEKLCEKMKHLLVDLGIKHAEFIVSLVLLEDFTPTGFDDVKFLFAANKNQQPGEIAKVASGGEISRVMLALKYVLSATKQLPVIIFDEIDTGLSGEVAHRMSQMMQEMATRMQVISISHLPQIAAAGNCQFKVYKEDNQDTTISKIRKLSLDERILEIAGMISGKEITSAAVETAKNLLRL
ncbi:MAG: DNA repair protein RecN [Odoribacter sp.]